MPTIFASQPTLDHKKSALFPTSSPNCCRYTLVRTIAADSGKGLAGHAAAAKALGAGLFLATPHHSREHGLSGHANGLVRQRFPKGADFRQVTGAQVKAVQDRTDARPGKSLGCLTPEEAFRKAWPTWSLPPEPSRCRIRRPGVDLPYREAPNAAVRSARSSVPAAPPCERPVKMPVKRPSSPPVSRKVLPRTAML